MEERNVVWKGECSEERNVGLDGRKEEVEDLALRCLRV